MARRKIYIFPILEILAETCHRVHLISEWYKEYLNNYINQLLLKCHQTEFTFLFISRMFIGKVGSQTLHNYVVYLFCFMGTDWDLIVKLACDIAMHWQMVLLVKEIQLNIVVPIQSYICV